eukprot:TRINITY_DN2915_c0_g1_i4.p1 TRINITY_DN2915_c0_g1~~TRINITY_DN2915_c0_g1_i4.p1  ORF type:complete len:195 (+),score=81.96 TRINITY_DN2915_c0_g1_i4:806-1390(+)
MESNISPEEWQRECERVSTRFKTQDKGDIKEWRTHLEQAKVYSERVKKLMPEVRSKLEKTSDELSRLMEKISGKEKVINKNFAHIVEEYRGHAEELKEVKQRSTQLSENYQKQQEILLEITERLEDVQTKMNIKGNEKTDTSPLVKIRKAINDIRQEIQAMEIRLGVVNNTLLQAKIRERSNTDTTKSNIDRIN